MRLTMTSTIGGEAINGVLLRVGNGHPSYAVTLPAGKAGALSTRTDANTGTLTLGAGHGITTAAVIDLYWIAQTVGSTDIVAGIRRGVTVGTVSGLSVPIDLGSGDDLPLVNALIVACVVTVLDVDITGSTIIACVAASQRRGSVSIQKNDGTVIGTALDLGRSGNDGESQLVYANDLGMTNPFSVDIGKVIVSNGDATGTSRVAIGFEVNA